MFDHLGDDELLRNALDGLPGAIDALVERVWRRALGIALAMRLGFHEAEDVAQTTALKVFRHLRGLSDRGSFWPWVGTIARHAAIDLKRKKKPRVGLGGEDDETALPEPASKEEPVSDVLERREESRRMVERLAELSPLEREIARLFYLEGLKIAEIALVVGKSYVRVGVILCELRKKLR